MSWPIGRPLLCMGHAVSDEAGLHLPLKAPRIRFPLDFTDWRRKVWWRAGMVNSNAMTAAHREKTDLLLQPPLAQIDMLNWSGFERAIAVGYEYAVRRLEKLPIDSPLVRCVVRE